MRFIVWVSLLAVTALAVSAEKKDDPHDSIIKSIQEDRDPAEALHESEKKKDEKKDDLEDSIIESVQADADPMSPVHPSPMRSTHQMHWTVQSTWRFSYPSLNFVLKITNGHLFINGVYIPLSPSRHGSLPAYNGWREFGYHYYVFYFNIYSPSLTPFAFAYGRRAFGTVTRVGGIPAYILQRVAKLSETWKFNFISAMPPFDLKFAAGKLTIFDQPVSLAASYNPYYSTSNGWVKLSFMKLVFYLRFRLTGVDYAAFMGMLYIPGTITRNGKAYGNAVQMQMGSSNASPAMMSMKKPGAPPAMMSMKKPGAPGAPANVPMKLSSSMKGVMAFMNEKKPGSPFNAFLREPKPEPEPMPQKMNVPGGAPLNAASQPAPPVVPGMPNMLPGMPNSSPGMPNIAKMSAPASSNILNSYPKNGVWKFNYPPSKFKFIVENSRTYIQMLGMPHARVYLSTSDRHEYPMELGWLTFDIYKWHFYLNFRSSTIQVAAYDQFNRKRAGSATKEGGGGGVIPSHIIQGINSLYGNYLARFAGINAVYYVYFVNGKMWFNDRRVYFSFSNDQYFPTKYGYVKWDFAPPHQKYFGFIRLTPYGVRIVLDAYDILYHGMLTKYNGALNTGAIKAGPLGGTAPMDQLQKGPLDQPQKGPLDQPQKGPLDQPQKGPLEQPQKGPLDQPQKGPLDQPQKGPLDQPQKGPMDQPQDKPEQDTTVE